MAVKELPVEFSNFLRRWVRRNSYDLKKLVPALRKYAKSENLTYAGGLGETKIRPAIVKGFILEAHKQKTVRTKREVIAELGSLGIEISDRTYEYNLRRLRDMQLLPENPDVELRRRQTRVKELATRFVADNLKKESIRSKDLSGYVKLITKRVGARLKDDQVTVTDDMIREILDELYWDAARVAEIKQTIHKGLPMQFYLDLLKHSHTQVPEWVLHDKWYAVKGRTPSQSADLSSNAGIWNVKDAFTYSGDFTVPTSAPDKPIVLDEGHDGVHRVATITAPHFGVAYDPDIVANFLRMTLADARRRKVDAIILSGRLFYIDTAAAGGISKIGRDLYSGISVDVDAFSKIYQDRVKEILVGMRPDELIYMTAQERLEHLLSGLWGVWVQPDLKPEFNGKVYAVMGPAEEAIAHVIAIARQRYETRKLKPRVDAELAAVNRLIKRELEEHGEFFETEEGHEKMEELNRLRDKYQDMSNRVAMANVHPIHARDDVPKILAWMARRIEKSIPNCKVIGQTTTFLKWKRTGATMQVYVDESRRPYDQFMSGHGLLDRQYGLSDVVLTVNPMAKYATTLAVESVHEPVRKTVLVCEPPLTLDKEAIRAQPTSRKARDSVISTAKSDLFVGGIQVFEFHKPVGDEQSRFPPTFYTVSDEHIRYAAAEAERTKKRAIYNPRHAGILGATDPHFTSMNSFFMSTEWGEIFNSFEGMMHLVQTWCMRKGGTRAPFVLFDVCDDWMQCANFPGYTNLHPERESITEMSEGHQEHLDRIEYELGKSRVNRKKILALVTEHSLWAQFQAYIRGEHTISEQLARVGDVLRRFRGVTKGILLTAADADVAVETPADVFGRRSGRTHMPKDRRSIGLINSGVSNHFTRSLDKNRPGMLFDSEIIRTSMVNDFTGDKELEACGYTQEYLEKVITAPRAEAESIGYGFLQLDDKDICPIEMRPSPIKRGPWHDPMSAQIRVDAQRADPSGLFVGKRRYRMFRTGDKHMGQVIVTGQSMYVMGMPGTLPDAFADIAGGIRPNSSGITVTLIPEQGISAGPTQTIFIPGYVIAYFVQNSEERFPLLEIMPKLI